MRWMIRWILYVLTFPTDLFALIAGLVVRLAWGVNVGAKSGCLLVFVRHDAWLARFMDRRLGGRWGGSTLGHVILLRADEHNHPSYGPEVLRHELIHVEQLEAHAILGLALALPLFDFVWWLALAEWALMPPLAYLASMLAAVLRGENGYRGSHLEEAAYNGSER